MNVSRYTDTTELRFDVEFITPTFLGGADGNAEIRTAPFKNLLRRWWRIANGTLSPAALWKNESSLFGSTEKDPAVVEENNALPKEKRLPEIFGKSKVELQIVGISPDLYVSDAPLFIGKDGYSDLASYTGYGAVSVGKNITSNEKKYIKPGTRVSFLLQCKNTAAATFEKTLFFIHLFATIGSRSRNGWGSIAIRPVSFKFDPAKYFPRPIEFAKVLAQEKQYPFCIGSDSAGMLCWQTKERFSNWTDAFEVIAKTYHQLVSNLKKDDKQYRTSWRDLLGFATAKDRLPSQLLLKICTATTKTASGVIKKSFYGQIVHTPYPIQNWDEQKKGHQLEAWKFIHDWLDGDDALTGCMGRKIVTGAAK